MRTPSSARATSLPTLLSGNAALTAMVAAMVLGCSSADSTPSTAAGGALGAGGSQQVGGASGTGGNPGGVGGATISSSSTGGRPNVGGADTTTTSGGFVTTGGTAATGGSRPMGGSPATGGAQPMGGGVTGGAKAIGGATGGAISTGGVLATGGNPAIGGATQAGGMGTGGASIGGASIGGASIGGASIGGKATTGGAPAAGGAGNGGNSGYQPCPSSPCKIMPLGDSITFGVGDEGNGGYRGPLFALAVAAGQKITFTGSMTNGPTTVSGQTFPKKNEGHSGWGISRVTPYSGSNAGIATVIPSPGFSSASGGIPDVILLHIGTNDSGSFTAAQMTSDLSGLIDKLIANAPNAYIVVAQIIPLGYGTNDVIKAYNQSIPGIVQQRAAAGKHITIVDMFTGFTTSSMIGSDSVHPNSTGYKFMADHWYSILGTFLPK